MTTQGDSDAGGVHESGAPLRPTLVRVEPSGIELEVRPRETVFSAARRAGLKWPTICGGKAQCTACHMLVVGGHDHLSDVECIEAQALAHLRRIPAPEGGVWRLACQTRLSGYVVVVKAGARASGGAGGSLPSAEEASDH